MADRRALEVEAAWMLHNQYRWNQHDDRAIPGMLDRLAEAQNWRCCYCGVRMVREGNSDARATFEHVVPRAYKGSDKQHNLVIACLRCNQDRGSEFRDEHLIALGLMCSCEVVTPT